jgi:hypothetical protein
MLDVHYSENSKRWGEGYALLQRASDLLANTIGSSEGVKATWDMVQDPQGRTLYRLTLQDPTGSVSTDFAPDELANGLHMRFRTYRIWGDLLQLRNKRQHEQVQLISGQISTGQEGH